MLRFVPGGSAAAPGAMALRERLHIYHLVPTRPHQLRQHRTGEALFILVRAIHVAFL